MIKYLTHLKDITGSNYVGISYFPTEVIPFLNKLKTHLGDEYDTYTSNQQNRDHGTHHITIINVMDYNRLSKDNMVGFTNAINRMFTMPIDDIKLMGIGKAERGGNTAYFVVARSVTLDNIRNKWGLPQHDFHITLGFKHRDVFGVRKNVVLDDKSNFLDMIKQGFLKRDNFEFLKDITNYEENKDLPIQIIDLGETFLKLIVSNKILNIGLVENGEGNEVLRILNVIEDDGTHRKLPTTEIIGILKK